MWFNGKINEKGVIYFVVNEWTCTDNDEYQYCRKVNETIFEYIQLKDGYFRDLAKKKNLIGTDLLSELNGKTMECDWYEAEIDVKDYTEKEAKEYLSPYNWILDKVTDEVSRNQILAECIFETDIVGFDFDY